jgi:hypothetical protein
MTVDGGRGAIPDIVEGVTELLAADGGAVLLVFLAGNNLTEVVFEPRRGFSREQAIFRGRLLAGAGKTLPRKIRFDLSKYCGFRTP